MVRFISAFVIVALGIAGAVGLFAGSATGEASTSATARASVANVDVPIRAIRTARQAVGGVPYKVERELFGTRRVWEVKLARAVGRPREVLVSANGRNVLRSKTTGRSDEANQAREARVGLAAAIRKAARRVGGRLDEADIDREAGQLVWEVTFRNGPIEIDVYVRLDNGHIIRIDRDDD